MKLFQTATGITCSSCTDRVNGTKCLSWNSVDCATIYGPKLAVCVFYPSIDRNFTHLGRYGSAAPGSRGASRAPLSADKPLILALDDQDRYCMAEEKLKSIYDITLVGNGSCSIYGNNETAPYVCTCVGEVCNSKVGVQLWLDQLTTTRRPTVTTTKKKCKCCCDEPDVSTGSRHLVSYYIAALVLVLWVMVIG